MSHQAGLSTSPAPPSPTPDGLTPSELGRWAWRQLTSMRTALLLLLLLAIAAVPGSVIPQQKVDELAVQRWQTVHPTLTPIYERLGLFSVYQSVWFSAIYVLLMVSLIGCIVPRMRQYWRAARAAPPVAPRNLSRLPAFEEFETTVPAAAVASTAASLLRRKRYRVAPAGHSEMETVAAQRGYLREAGNLVFHASLLVVLVAYAYGSMYGYKGGVIVVSGQGFSNARAQYDDFVPGSRFDTAQLTPFNFILDAFQVSFLRSGPQAGMPTAFSADLTYQERPDAPPATATLEVNRPLTIDGTSIFLVGHGYAPVVTVRDRTGKVAYSGPTVFLPQDSSFASYGVVKAPDAQPEALGFEGMLLPTYGFTMETGPYSRFPDALAPVLTLAAYHGDLGMDNGTPQSVYVLRKQGLDEYMKPDGNPFRVDLPLGATRKLPDGGEITFDGMRRWAKFQISRTPAEPLALGGVAVGLLGLIGSLFVRPRRIWVTTRSHGPTTLVQIGGLDRMSGGRASHDVSQLRSRLMQEPQ